MNNDGWGQVGAGQDDRRMVGKDLQHYVQARTADENPSGVRRVVHASLGAGGPVKELLDAEKARHRSAAEMRIQHLANHIKR